MALLYKLRTVGAQQRPAKPWGISSPLPYLLFLSAVFITASSFDNNRLFWLVYDLNRTDLLHVIMAFCAKYLFVFILLVALGWIYWRLRQRIWVFITAFLGIATLSYLLAKLSTHLIIDPRPYIQYHLTPLISVAADNGFPSDHTLISFAAAATVALFDKKAGWVLCGLALLVGVARVYVAAHHPLDIAGSMLIVLISTFIVWCIGNFLAHRMAANQQQ